MDDLGENMVKQSKRIISILLAVVIIWGVFPTSKALALTYETKKFSNSGLSTVSRTDFIRYGIS